MPVSHTVTTWSVPSRPWSWTSAEYETASALWTTHLAISLNTNGSVVRSTHITPGILANCTRTLRSTSATTHPLPLNENLSSCPPRAYTAFAVASTLDFSNVMIVTSILADVSTALGAI